jgi:hypothetical protein
MQSAHPREAASCFQTVDFTVREQLAAPSRTFLTDFTQLAAPFGVSGPNPKQLAASKWSRASFGSSWLPRCDNGDRLEAAGCLRVVAPTVWKQLAASAWSRSPSGSSWLPPGAFNVTKKACAKENQKPSSIVSNRVEPGPTFPM